MITQRIDDELTAIFDGCVARSIAVSIVANRVGETTREVVEFKAMFFESYETARAMLQKSLRVESEILELMASDLQPGEAGSVLWLMGRVR